MKICYFIEHSLHYLPIIVPLIQKTGGTIISLVKNTHKYLEHTKNNFNILYYKNFNRLKRDLKSLPFEIIVHPGFSIELFNGIPGLKHVQVFHGLSDKPYSFNKSLKYYDLITVPGLKKKEDIVRRGLAEENKIKIIGYPKIDAFLHSDFDAQAFRNKLGLKEDIKVILYAPTWNDPYRYSSFNKYIIPLLRDLTKYYLIVKPHSNILRDRPWQLMKAYLKKGKHTVIYPKAANILPFMAVSDLLITDISSIAHEYLPFDKPMVFLSPRPKALIPREHKWIWQCGDVIERGKKILPVIQENIEHPDKYRKQRHYAMKQVFYKFDRKSPCRFMNALQNL
ncbi:MAG: CDP-glycerol glycerophosphotransferase family protein [Spirochaetes bacterium]|nr:CDP-glycerol glycerophosphotransferase family protein [Spirochaetota bacterium]